MCKKLSSDDLVIGGVPRDWTTGAWEVFLRFGAVGSDEPWLKTEAAPRTATPGASLSTRVNPISRAEVRNAKREFAIERKKGKKPMSEIASEVKAGKVDLTAEEEGRVRSPVKDTLVHLVQGMQDKIVNAMDKNTERLHDFVDRMSKDTEATQAMNAAKLANKEKELATKGVDNLINALKILLSIYPPGSQECKNALLEVECLASIPPSQLIAFPFLLRPLNTTTV